MAIPLPTDAVIDYLSITHRNIYRLPITPDQRCIIRKYLRLIETEIDEKEFLSLDHLVDERGVLQRKISHSSNS